MRKKIIDVKVQGRYVATSWKFRYVLMSQTIKIHEGHVSLSCQM